MQYRVDKALFIPFSKKNNIKDDYEFGEELGRGGYAFVFLATHKISKIDRAIKIIRKSEVDDEDLLRNEFKILMQLDHPNIIKLIEIYETDNFIYLVQELCSGGELFQHIVKTRHLTEGDAARIMRQIFSAVAYCHANNVCHRDIKPENFLLKTPNDISSIKLIDFGLAKKVKKNEKMRVANGTPYYIAPEIIMGSYSKIADNWSLGVVLYVMLSGVPPFYGSNNKEVLKSVLKGIYTFNLKPFKTCSDEVKDLISKLLVRTPEKRYSAMAAYNHPWVQQQVDEESKDIVISPQVIDNLQTYMNYQGFKKTILYMIAGQLPEEDMTEFRAIFIKLDTNGDGFLSEKEFAGVFKELEDFRDVEISEENVSRLFKSLDLNQSNSVDYTEFLAAFTLNQVYRNERYLMEVFTKLDQDQDGKITKAELEAFFNREAQFLNNNELISIIDECDYNRDGVIDYNELIKHMRGKRKEMLLGNAGVLLLNNAGVVLTEKSQDG